MPVTLKDISHAAGVSIPTVSLILNGKGDQYNVNTRKRVLKTAKELGYRPNAGALAMRRGRFNTIAILQTADYEKNQLPGPTLGGIRSTLEPKDMHVMLAALPDEKLTSKAYVPKILREWMTDGLLINYTHGFPERMIELIDEFRIPSIWINTKQKHDCAYPDDLAGGVMATEYLLALGHRDIAYMDVSHASDKLEEAHYSARDRLAGYEQAMKAAGAKPRVILGDAGGSSANRLPMLTALLGRGDRPRAILAYGHSISIAYAAARCGVRIPEELSFVSFDAKQRSDLGLPITTAEVPCMEVGCAAAKMLLDKIDRVDRKLPAKVLGFRMAEGRTVAPAK